MTTRKRDRRVAQEPHYLRLEKLTADRRVNDRRGPVDAIREKLAQELHAQRELNAELVASLGWLLHMVESHTDWKKNGDERHLKAMSQARAVLAKVKQ